ncbi:hypothetical protein EV144_101433 [Flavobacterium sp. 270]|uniref:hypothetical protein n=1 Tax=Flavobacterium sp. 270 TaxID=2512114 RepID=UPI0010670E53|nr:hypothetical protein [Flavobacterium sp. 270]TDW51756.1 hypothetical protein EV144_101433 [Flavobacterium sp. 270]
MDTLKYISLIVLLIFINCKRITYTKDNSSFDNIILRDWNSSICPKKIIYERYVKNSNFKKLIKTDSIFDTRDCEEGYKTFNQRVLIPYILGTEQRFITGKIDYDVRLVLDDSLEFKITFINNKIDTVFSGGRPGDLIIMNNIKSLIVNGYKLDNTKSPLNIDIPTKLGKIIKK